MKGGTLIASSLIALAHAGVHKMPLTKVSLNEQLAAANIQAHSQHLAQKYVGYQPEPHIKDMFHDTSIKEDHHEHPVPISNFLNAQCKIYFSYLNFCLNYLT